MFSPPVSSGKNGPTSLGSGHFSGSSTSPFPFFPYFFFFSFPSLRPPPPFTPARYCFACCLNFLVLVTISCTCRCGILIWCSFALWIFFFFSFWEDLEKLQDLSLWTLSCSCVVQTLRVGVVVELVAVFCTKMSNIAPTVRLSVWLWSHVHLS